MAFQINTFIQLITLILLYESVSGQNIETLHHTTSQTSEKTITTTVGVTCASTFIAAALLFLCIGHKKKEIRESTTSSGAVTEIVNLEAGLVEENSLSGWKKFFSRGKGSAPGKNQIHPKDTAQTEKVETIINVVEELTVPPPPPPPPPPLPPVLVKKGPAAPPLPGLRPPIASKKLDEEKGDKVKLKPLHWEKVNVGNRNHSMVWDNLEHGSFQYNGDMMEALFDCNTNAINNKVPNPATKIFILDSRRSQNIAIVIRSLGVSIPELIDGLSEGKGLNIETLEKLTRIAPANEEKLKILTFTGEFQMLADAESFLYRLLKSVPSAFTRVNAMLFRHTYDSDIQQLKDCLHTLDLACTELHSRGMFLKLLEAILKAGNRVNAGTTRGDAEAFNLTALCKLSDYKGIDGKTTLLHFIVHEVVRNEGRRHVIKNLIPDESKSKSDQEKEILKLGLPVIAMLSSELSNVRKSAVFDYNTVLSITSVLGVHIHETRELVSLCEGEEEEGEFVKEMKEFLEGAENEIKTLKEEEIRVMEFVKTTTQYFQSGGFEEKQPFQLFCIVKDFLSMVDKVCVEITRNLKQKKKGNVADVSISQTIPTVDVVTKGDMFTGLQDERVSEKLSGSDSDDDD